LILEIFVCKIPSIGLFALETNVDKFLIFRQFQVQILGKVQGYLNQKINIWFFGIVIGIRPSKSTFQKQN
jgi:hypothetical protein